MAYWLMKSEPNEYSIDDLEHDPKGWEHWDGVRNYQARNYMRQMKVGDRVFFYHSNTDVPGIVGVAEVCREAYPDHTAFDPDDKHYDPKSDPDKPRWFMVDVRFVEKFPGTLSLQTLRQHAEALGDFPLLRKGNRLSVMPVSDDQWHYLYTLARKID